MRTGGSADSFLKLDFEIHARTLFSIRSHFVTVQYDIYLFFSLDTDITRNDARALFCQISVLRRRFRWRWSVYWTQRKIWEKRGVVARRADVDTPFFETSSLPTYVASAIRLEQSSALVALSVFSYLVRALLCQ